MIPMINTPVSITAGCDSCPAKAMRYPIPEEAPIIFRSHNTHPGKAQPQPKAVKMAGKRRAKLPKRRSDSAFSHRNLPLLGASDLERIPCRVLSSTGKNVPKVITDTLDTSRCQPHNKNRNPSYEGMGVQGLGLRQEHFQTVWKCHSSANDNTECTAQQIPLKYRKWLIPTSVIIAPLLSLLLNTSIIDTVQGVPKH
jgi:hypothetical protein